MYSGNYKKDYVSLQGPYESSNQSRLLSENGIIMLTSNVKLMDLLGDSLSKRFLDLDTLNSANATSLQESKKDASRIFMPFGCTLR